jgi:hypothetical protein
VPQQQLARLSQRDRARPAGALDEPFADRALESLDLLAYRRLRVPKASRGAAEGALARNRLERQEMAQLDTE